MLEEVSLSALPAPPPYHLPSGTCHTHLSSKKTADLWSLCPPDPHRPCDVRVRLELTALFCFPVSSPLLSLFYLLHFSSSFSHFLNFSIKIAVLTYILLCLKVQPEVRARVLWPHYKATERGSSVCESAYASVLHGHLSGWGGVVSEWFFVSNWPLEG